MKSIGIIRKVDALGRIVLPKELRDSLDIAIGDSLEIYMCEDNIVLHKYVRGCVFCGNIDNIVLFREKEICRKCLTEIEFS